MYKKMYILTYVFSDVYLSSPVMNVILYFSKLICFAIRTIKQIT